MSTSVRHNVGSGSGNYQEDMALVYHMSTLPKNPSSHVSQGVSGVSVDINTVNGSTTTSAIDSTLRMTTRHHQTSNSASFVWGEDASFAPTDESRVHPTSTSHKKKCVHNCFS